MWKKHQSLYQDHLKHVRIDIVKPFHVGILRWAERIMEMHNLSEYLPPPSIKGDSYELANCKFCDQ